MDALSFAKKFIGIFDTREKYQMAALSALMLGAASFEVLGIGMILPFIGLLSNPGMLGDSRLLSRLYDSLGMTSVQQFMLFVGCALLAVYLVKNVYLAYLGYAQSKFVYDKQASLSRRLLDAYLHSPYTFHLQRNTAELLQNITKEVIRLTGGIMLPALMLLTESLVLVFIIALLLAIEPYVALVTLTVIGMITFLIQHLLKNVLKKYGEKTTLHGGLMIKWVNQALGSVKETKILGHERFFVDSFHASSQEYAHASQMFTTLNNMPRLLVETVVVGGMLLVVVMMLTLGNDMHGMLPILALFAVAATRLMPSVTRILSALNSLRFGSSATATLFQDLDNAQVERASESQISNEDKASESGRSTSVYTSELELRQVWYKYPGADLWSVRNVSLKIPRGSSVAFVGPTGAGKSTLVDLILGLLKPEKGCLLVDGVEMGYVITRWQGTIGYVPQSIYLLDDTIRRNIAFGLRDEEINDIKIWQALRSAQLEAKVKSLSQGLETYVGERGVRLAGGERQRIGIARALYNDPEILVFDEATSALDNKTEKEISEAVASLIGQKTLIIIAHRLSTIKSCRQIFFLKNGMLLDSGAYSELLNRNHEFELMVGKGIS